MIIPNSDGYTLFSLDTSHISTNTSRLLLQHRVKKYRYLFDRLLMVCPDLVELVGYIKKVSKSWFERFRGRTITFIMRVLVVYAATPQRYHYSGDYIMASNYTKLRFYFQRIIKVMRNLYNIPKRKYKFEIKKQNLFYISKLFANDMIDECIRLVPRYEMLLAKQGDN